MRSGTYIGVCRAEAIDTIDRSARLPASGDRIFLSMPMARAPPMSSPYSSRRRGLATWCSRRRPRSVQRAHRAQARQQGDDMGPGRPRPREGLAPAKPSLPTRRRRASRAHRRERKQSPVRPAAERHAPAVVERELARRGRTGRRAAGAGVGPTAGGGARIFRGVAPPRRDSARNPGRCCGLYGSCRCRAAPSTPSCPRAGGPRANTSAAKRRPGRESHPIPACDRARYAQPRDARVTLT